MIVLVLGFIAIIINIAIIMTMLCKSTEASSATHITLSLFSTVILALMIVAYPVGPSEAIVGPLPKSTEFYICASAAGFISCVTVLMLIISGESEASSKTLLTFAGSVLVISATSAAIIIYML